MFYHFAGGTSGEELYLILEEVLGIDMDLFRIKVENVPSYIYKYDSIANYAGDGDVLFLTPALLGGAKGRIPVKKVLTKTERLQNAQASAREVEKHEAGALECIRKVSDSMAKFATLTAEVGRMKAINDTIASLPEGVLVNANQVLDSKCPTATKLKNLSQLIYGQPMVDTKSLHMITGSIMETGDLLLTTAIEKTQDEPNPVSMPWLKNIVRDQLNQRIGARSVSAMAD
eukprot:Skav209111  [mRNA]  locus=scaffold179:217345:218034:- [translate_table: standard]